jgi:hypothetical protein
MCTTVTTLVVVPHALVQLDGGVVPTGVYAVCCMLIVVTSLCSAACCPASVLAVMNVHMHVHSQSTSLCLVTHGLTMRVFLMRWFHWTVESFLQVCTCVQYGGCYH